MSGTPVSAQTATALSRISRGVLATTRGLSPTPLRKRQSPAGAPRDMATGVGPEKGSSTAPAEAQGRGGTVDDPASRNRARAATPAAEKATTANADAGHLVRDMDSLSIGRRRRRIPARHPLEVAARGKTLAFLDRNVTVR